MARILAVDDDEAIRNLLGRVLGKDGHDVRCAACAEEVLALKLDRYDLVLLDVMMPGTDGFELCRAIRGSVDAPIVFLTARSSEDDAVYGLGLGADDYLRKPFGAAELRARVAAHLRRERRERKHALSFGALRLDLASREAYVGEATVPLTKTEFDVCEFLAPSRPGVLARPDRGERAGMGRGKRRVDDIGACGERARETEGGGRRAHRHGVGSGVQMDGVRRDARTHGALGASRGRGRRFPLGALILRYFAYVLAALLALALAAYAAFGLLVGSGTVLLANYGDTALDETSAQLAALPSADADAIDAAVPSAYRWALFSPDGAYAAGDVASGAVDDARAAAFDGLAIDYETFGMTRYEPVTLADGSVCVLVYQYLPQFASKDLRDALPNPQNLLLGALAVLSVLTLVGIAARAARVISRKMEPLADAVRRIEERDLDFEVASSRVREIDDVLAAMDGMRASLKDSLEAQWRGEQAQREQIAALAHDLKTPLTVVRGNVDLLL